MRKDRKVGKCRTGRLLAMCDRLLKGRELEGLLIGSVHRLDGPKINAFDRTELAHEALVAGPSVVWVLLLNGTLDKDQVYSFRSQWRSNDQC